MTRKMAAGIVELILSNLMDRGGFGGWWDGIDPVTRTEIRESLITLVQATGDVAR